MWNLFFALFLLGAKIVHGRVWHASNVTVIWVLCIFAQNLKKGLRDKSSPCGVAHDRAVRLRGWFIGGVNRSIENQCFKYYIQENAYICLGKGDLGKFLGIHLENSACAWGGRRNRQRDNVVPSSSSPVCTVFKMHISVVENTSSTEIQAKANFRYRNAQFDRALLLLVCLLWY